MEYQLVIGVMYEIVMRKYIIYNKQYQKDLQTIKSFDNLYRKSLQHNLIDKNDYESLCNKFTENLDETRKAIFSLKKLKLKKIKLFS